MVLFLIVYVCFYSSCRILAYSKGTISALPFEEVIFGKMMSLQVRGAAFDPFDQIGE